MTAGSEGTDVLETAWSAFIGSDWERARELFEQALEDEPSPEALDGLGQVLWWLGEEEAAIETRTKAFGEYRQRRDAEAAGNVAAYLAAEYRIAGNASLAEGWLGRATRTLDGCPDCPGLGWLHIERSKRAGTPEEAGREAETALEIARRIGDAGIEGAALSHVGMARIRCGEADDGLALLNEAMAIATGGEAEDPLAIGDACCTTLSACERLADPQRVLDWGRAVSEFFRRRRYLPLLSWCRSVYASFLIATGQWEDAERQLEQGLSEEATLPNPSRASALVQLADLRWRQGRLEEADRLLEGLEDRPSALATVIGIHLARGDVDLAAEKVERRLESLGDDPVALAQALLLRAEVAIARGDATASVQACAQARESAELVRRADLKARASVLRARSARIVGESPDPDELEAAIECFAQSGLMLEAAAARLELARALAPEHRQLAIEQGRAALRTFDDLGAARHADEAAGVLRELGAPGRAAPRSATELTKREQQVLGLLGEGLSNPQIAERLVISPRTAEHHVRAILRKLDLANRAEAAAYAARRP